MRTELLDSGRSTWTSLCCWRTAPRSCLLHLFQLPDHYKQKCNLNVLSERVTQTAQHTSMTTATHLIQLDFKLANLIVGSGLWPYASAFKRIASAPVIIFMHEPPTLIWKLLLPKGISLSN